MKFQLAFTTFIALSSAVALRPRDDDDDDRNDRGQVAAPAATSPIAAPAPVAPAPARPEGCTDDDDDDDDPRCRVGTPAPAPAPAPAQPAPSRRPEGCTDDNDDDDDSRCRVGVAAPAPAQPNTTPTPRPAGYRDDDGDDDDDDDCYDDGNDRFRSEIPGCAGRNTRVPGAPRPSTPAAVGAAPTPVPSGRRGDDDDDDDDDDCYDDGNDRFRSEIPACVGRNTRVPGQPRPTTPVAGGVAVDTTRASTVTPTTRPVNSTATRTGIVASFTGGASKHVTTGWVAGAVIAVAGMLAY